MRTRSARRAAVTALAATLLLTACADGAGEAAAPEDDPEAAFLAHARCMREHGIDMPDPQIQSDGEGFAVRMDRSIDVDDSAFHRAEKACAKHLPKGRPGGGEIDPEQERRMQEGALAFARCMREHGIDMPDPKFADGMIRVEAAPGAGGDSAAWRKATEACRDRMPGPDGEPGGGPGFSVETRRADER